MDRTCSHCNIAHPLTSDHWFRINKSPMCKVKYAKIRRERYLKNKDKEKQLHKEYVAKNKESIKQYLKEYRKNNREALNKKVVERKRCNAQYRIACNLRSRLTKITKEKHGVSSVRNLGCSPKEFKKYLESKFVPGMTWDNYGASWHIDHIFPLSKADLTKQDELLRVCHYSNLQPMWAVDNIKKGNKIKCL